MITIQKIKPVLVLLLTIILFNSCEFFTQKKDTVKIQRKRIKPASTGFHFEDPKDWLKKNNTAAHLHLALAVNRTDSMHLTKMDSVLIPNDLNGDIEFYLPFPLYVSSLKHIQKIIFFSYPSQTFAAYENGELLFTGPTNMGRKADPTPAGLYYCNWKAEQTTSTFNDEWELKWNFNIENKLGIGFHQYELPGYPASHSCLRLLEKDARLLYNWADQWILDKKENLLAKGTPVIVFGEYNFDATKPWLQLINDPHALDINEATLEQISASFLMDIEQQQKKRATIVNSKL